MDPGLLRFLLVPIVIIPVLLLGIVWAKWRGKQAEQILEDYFRKQENHAEVLGGWMPPLRLWARNRKHDMWCKVRWEDGRERWARVRHTFMDGQQIEFFD